MTSNVFQELEVMAGWARELTCDLDMALNKYELPTLRNKMTWRGEMDELPDKAVSLFMLNFDLPCGFSTTISRSVGHPKVEVVVGLKDESQKDSQGSREPCYKATDFPDVESASAKAIAEFICNSTRDLARKRVRIDDQRLRGSQTTLRSLTRSRKPAQLAVLQRHELPSQVTEFLFLVEKGDPVGERGVEIDVRTAREEAFSRATKWAEEHPEVDQVELYYSGLTEATLGALKGLEASGLVVYLMRYNTDTRSYERLSSMP